MPPDWLKVLTCSTVRTPGPTQEEAVAVFPTPVPGSVVFVVSQLRVSVWSPPPTSPMGNDKRSEEHTSELQSRSDLVCRLLLEKKKIIAVQTACAHSSVLCCRR